ncbi:MAG: reverse transcriptase N-terminal domain-containing protein [Clostridiales bacterium]|nr:reverse transcriptase N-terminal domain-containing protein [Clostridiales bacterium]
MAVKRLQYLLTLSYYAKLLVIRKVTTHKGKELLVWARFYGQLRRVRCALSFRTYLEKLSYIKLRYYIFQL